MAGSRNGIVTAGMPRVATRYAAHGQHTATHKSMSLQRLCGVLRTRREKSAILPKHGAYGVLVGANEQQEYFAHSCFEERLASSKRSTSAIIVLQSIGLFMGPVTRITQSRPSSRILLCRNHSLRTRFERLRSTAWATKRFGTTNPNLATPDSVLLRRTANLEPRQIFPA